MKQYLYLKAKEALTCLSTVPLLVYIHSAAPLKTVGTGLNMQAIQLGTTLLDHMTNYVVVDSQCNKLLQLRCILSSQWDDNVSVC
jgi:hypothetical protein